MPHYAYGTEHRRKRLTMLAVTPAGTLCPFADSDPKCPGPMYPGAELLDLNHSDPAMKQAGLPGDQLAHRACNRRARNRKIPPEVAAKRERQTAADQATLTLAVPTSRCPHKSPYYREPFSPGCDCSDPLRHHVANAMKLKAGTGGNPLLNHNPPPCPGCGGWSHSRIW